MSKSINRKKKTLLATVTGEYFQLARIYYDLFDQKKAQKIFFTLNCMDFDKAGDRWVWLYHGESKKLKFKTSYTKIPKHLHPIVIGSFFSKTKDEMFINVNSFDRAKEAILFFDKYIPRSVAKVTDIVVVNKLFEGVAGSMPKHEEYFDKRFVFQRDPEKLLEKLKSSNSSKKKHTNILDLLSSDGDDDLNKLPEIEKFPTNFIEDEGITGLAGSLHIRQTIALQHWVGNTNYSFNDVFKEIIPKIM